MNYDFRLAYMLGEPPLYARYCQHMPDNKWRPCCSHFRGLNLANQLMPKCDFNLALIEARLQGYIEHAVAIIAV